MIIIIKVNFSDYSVEYIKTIINKELIKLIGKPEYHESYTDSGFADITDEFNVSYNASYTICTVYLVNLKNYNIEEMFGNVNNEWTDSELIYALQNFFRDFKIKQIFTNSENHKK